MTNNTEGNARDRIIEALTEYGELNVTRLARITGIHYRVLVKYLSKMLEEGIVEERRFGRLRIIGLNRKKR
jgi:predicted transcriptional regulator